MSQITEQPAGRTTASERDQAELRAIFERLRKLPKYAKPWDEFIAEWAPMDPEDRDDLITHREIMQRYHDGEEEFYSLEELKEQLGL